VSDITYIRVNDDWNYLTTIIYLADRKVVIWTLTEDSTPESTVYKELLLARKIELLVQITSFIQIEEANMPPTR
jgi:transposase InsO family protein